jgi:hypothetical protein
MANDLNGEEKQIGAADVEHRIPDTPPDEKANGFHEETAHEAAERGKVATDK